MKKSMFIFAVALALFGCNESEKKVTPEMLVGEWECYFIDKHYDKKGADYILSERNSFLLNVKFQNQDGLKVNNWALVKSLHPFILEQYYEQPKEEPYYGSIDYSSEQLKLKTSKNIHYISYNEFNTIVNYELILVDKSLDNELIKNSIQKTDASCKRIN